MLMKIGKFIDQTINELTFQLRIGRYELFMIYLNKIELLNQIIPNKTVSEVDAFILSKGDKFLPKEVLASVEGEFKRELIPSKSSDENVPEHITRFQGLFAINGYLEDMKRQNKPISRKLGFEIHGFNLELSGLPAEIITHMMASCISDPDYQPSTDDNCYTFLRWVERRVKSIWLDTQFDQSTSSSSSSSQKVSCKFYMENCYPHVEPHFYDNQENVVTRNGNTSRESVNVGSMLVKRSDF
ncbi:hypothetical protein NE237_029834 [Protea cynaroides]|uniref:Uncharacterized protein n=1 Tax=Protea cynaroides TaxID=273540 RepID=A0A9Q0GRX7_9MAGN|nr:hypothetical protein NE237_029834 [Protea cynaroides]